MSTGEVPQPEVLRLQDMGKWLAINGEAIYATRPTLFGDEAGALSTTEKDENGKLKFIPSWKWRSTTTANRIYIHLFEWPGTTFHLSKVPRQVTGAWLLADSTHSPLKVARTADGIDVTLPAKAPNPIASVLVLKTA
jgi:alpha-L-fucosidase